MSFSVIRIKPADRNDKVSGISHMVLLLHNYDAVHAAYAKHKGDLRGSSSVVSVTDLVFDFTVAAPKDWPQEAAAVHNQTFFRFFFNFQKLNLVWFPSSELLDYNNQAFGPILAPKTRSCWSVTKKKKKKSTVCC